MKLFKKFTGLLVLSAMLSSLVPATALAANTMRGATANFDYVYSVANDTESLADKVEENDDEYGEVFPERNDDDQYLYLGMRSPLDVIYFKFNKPVRYESSSIDSLEWEYSDGDDWRDLSIEEDETEGFTESGINAVEFDIPSAWEEDSFKGKKAYWVRVKPEGDVNLPGRLDQVSARAYTVKIKVKDDDGDKVKGLTSSDFDLDGGSDNKIYGFINNKDGSYEFAIQSEAVDTTYKLTIDDSAYDKEYVTLSSVTSDQRTYKVTLDDDDDEDDDDEDDDDDTPFRDIQYHWCRNAVENLYERDIVEGRSYYYYEPDDQVTRAEFLKMVLLNDEDDFDLDDYDDEDEPFKDVSSNDWFYEYVLAGYELDIIQRATYFYPSSEINRAEAVTMLVRFADVSTSSSRTIFSDVDQNDWYAKYVRAAYNYDVIEGYDDGTFGASNSLTRAEAAVMIDNAFEAWYD